MDEEYQLEEEIEGGDSGEQSGGMQIPKHRFDEVNTKLKQTNDRLAAYSKFGNPEELEQLVSKARSAPASEEELNSYDEQLRNIPSFQRVAEFVERQSVSEEKARGAFLDAAEGKFQDYAKNLGIPVTDGRDTQALLYDIQAQVAEQIRRDPNLAARFMRNDMGAVDEAYQRASSTGLIGMLKRARTGSVHSIKTKGTRQPSNPRAAGSSQQRQPDRPLSENEMFAKAAESGYDVLLSRSEE